MQVRVAYARAKLGMKSPSEQFREQTWKVNEGTYEVAVSVAERRDDARRHFVDNTNAKYMSEVQRMLFGLVVTITLTRRTIGNLVHSTG